MEVDFIDKEAKEQAAGELLAKLWREARFYRNAFYRWATAREAREQAAARARKAAALEAENIVNARAKKIADAEVAAAAVEATKLLEEETAKRLAAEAVARTATEEADASKRLAEQEAARAAAATTDAKAATLLSEKEAARAAIAAEKLTRHEEWHIDYISVTIENCFNKIWAKRTMSICFYAWAKSGHAAKLQAIGNELAVLSKLRDIELKDAELRHQEELHSVAGEYQSQLHRKQMQWMDELQNRTIILERSASQSKADMLEGHQRILGECQIEHVQELQGMHQILATTAAHLSEHQIAMKQDSDAHERLTATLQSKLDIALADGAELKARLLANEASLDIVRHQCSDAGLRRVRSSMLECVITYWKKHVLDFRHRYQRWTKFAIVLQGKLVRTCFWRWLHAVHKLCRHVAVQRNIELQSERDCLVDEHAKKLTERERFWTSAQQAIQRKALHDLSERVDSIRHAFRSESEKKEQTMKIKLSKLHAYCYQQDEILATQISFQIATQAAATIAQQSIIEHMKKRGTHQLLKRSHNHLERMVWTAWCEVSAHEWQTKRLMAKIIHRLSHNMLGAALASLKEFTHSSRRQRAMMSRAVSMIHVHRLAGTFATWVSVQRKRHKAKLFLASKRSDARALELSKKLAEVEQQRRQDAQQQILHQAHAQQLSAEALKRAKEGAQKNFVRHLLWKHENSARSRAFQHWVELIVQSQRQSGLVFRANEMVRKRRIRTGFGRWLMSYRRTLKSQLISHALGAKERTENITELISWIRTRVLSLKAKESTLKKSHLQTEGKSLHFAEECDNIAQMSTLGEDELATQFTAWRQNLETLQSTVSLLCDLLHSSESAERNAKSLQELQHTEHEAALKTLNENHRFQSTMLKNEMQAEIASSVAETSRIQSALEIAETDLAAAVAAHRGSLRELQNTHEAEFTRLRSQHRSQQVALENEVTAATTASAVARMEMESTLEANSAAKLAAASAEYQASIQAALAHRDEQHEEAVKKLTCKHEQNQSAMERQVASAISASAAAIAESEATLVKENESHLAALKAEHRVAMSNMESKLSDMQIAHRNATTASNRKYESEIADAKSAHDMNVANRQSQHEAEVARLKLNHRAQQAALEDHVTQIKNSSEATLMQVETVLSAKADANVASLVSAHQAEISDQQSRHISEISRLKREHQQAHEHAVNTMTKQHQAAIQSETAAARALASREVASEMEAKAEAVQASLMSAHQTALSDMRDQHDAEIAELNQRHNAQNHALKEQAAAAAKAVKLETEATMDAKAEAKLSEASSAHCAALTELQLQHEAELADQGERYATLEKSMADDDVGHDAALAKMQHGMDLMRETHRAELAAVEKEAALTSSTLLAETEARAQANAEAQVEAKLAEASAAHRLVQSEMESQHKSSMAEQMNALAQLQGQMDAVQETTQSECSEWKQEASLHASKMAQIESRAVDAKTAHDAALAKMQHEMDLMRETHRAELAAVEKE
eukprot:SAG31_NODE_2982_length_4825_cov_2.489420_1_plen_1488_part_01